MKIDSKTECLNWSLLKHSTNPKSIYIIILKTEIWFRNVKIYLFLLQKHYFDNGNIRIWKRYYLKDLWTEKVLQKVLKGKFLTLDDKIGINEKLKTSYWGMWIRRLKLEYGIHYLNCHLCWYLRKKNKHKLKNIQVLGVADEISDLVAKDKITITLRK